jgi:CDP-glucose 4,6-dehydratase
MNSLEFNSLKELSGPVLITGHTGFKGTWLTLILEAMGISTCGYSLKAEEKSLYKICSREGLIEERISDIRNYDSLSKFLNRTKPSIVIHLAAQPLVLESYKNPKYTFETNALGTVNVLDSSFKCDSVKAVLIATTDKVYKNTKSYISFKENDSLEGSDPYSSSKVAAEAAASAWQKIYSMSSGPKVLIARAGNVIGGGDFSENRLIPDLINGFTNDKGIVIRNSSSTRPWQHVIEPIYGYLKYIEHGLVNKPERALNFGPIEKSKSVREIVEIAQKTWGLKTSVVFEESNLNIESEHLDIDPSLAISNLAWQPRWTQEEAVIATIEWWKKVLIEKADPTEACLNDFASYIK